MPISYLHSLHFALQPFNDLREVVTFAIKGFNGFILPFLKHRERLDFFGELLVLGPLLVELVGELGNFLSLE